MKGLQSQERVVGINSGWSVSGVGDMNKDGYSDVLVGAPNTDNSAGVTYVIYGNSSMSNIMLSNLTAGSSVTIVGANIRDNIGVVVNAAGDVNNDGYMDIVLGSYQAGDNAGASYILYGGNNTASVIELGSLTTTQ